MGVKALFVRSATQHHLSRTASRASPTGRCSIDTYATTAVSGRSPIPTYPFICCKATIHSSGH